MLLSVMYLSSFFWSSSNRFFFAADFLGESKLFGGCSSSPSGNFSRRKSS